MKLEKRSAVEYINLSLVNLYYHLVSSCICRKVGYCSERFNSCPPVVAVCQSGDRWLQRLIRCSRPILGGNLQFSRTEAICTTDIRLLAVRQTARCAGMPRRRLPCSRAVEPHRTTQHLSISVRRWQGSDALSSAAAARPSRFSLCIPSRRMSSRRRCAPTEYNFIFWSSPQPQRHCLQPPS